MRPSLVLWWIALAPFGCSNPYDREGTEPFECRDGADNDQDGYYDCDDNGCWGSPDCEDGAGGDDTGKGDDTGDDTGSDTGGLDTDTGGGDTGGGDTDTALGGGDTADTADTGNTTDCGTFLCDLETVRIEYKQTHDVIDDGTACQETVPICDCEVVFHGEGTFLETEGWRVTFQGTFEVTATNGASQAACDSFAAGTWHDAEGAAYHSIHFRNLGEQLDVWVAHGYPSGYEPIYVASDAMAASQFSIWDMRRTWDDSTLTVVHEESGVGYIGGFLVSTQHHAEFYFNEP